MTMNVMHDTYCNQYKDIFAIKNNLATATAT